MKRRSDLRKILVDEKIVYTDKAKIIADFYFRFSEIYEDIVVEFVDFNKVKISYVGYSYSQAEIDTRLYEIENGFINIIHREV